MLHVLQRRENQPSNNDCIIKKLQIIALSTYLIFLIFLILKMKLNHRHITKSRSFQNKTHKTRPYPHDRQTVPRYTKFCAMSPKYYQLSVYFWSRSRIWRKNTIFNHNPHQALTLCRQFSQFSQNGKKFFLFLPRSFWSRRAGRKEMFYF